MITNFKIFEDINKPKIGDYVLMRSETGIDYISEYINEHVAKIKLFDAGDGVYVEYEDDDCPFDPIRQFSVNQIVYFSKNRKEIELKIAAKKYNI